MCAKVWKENKKIKKKVGLKGMFQVVASFFKDFKTARNTTIFNSLKLLNIFYRLGIVLSMCRFQSYLSDSSEKLFRYTILPLRISIKVNHNKKYRKKTESAGSFDFFYTFYCFVQQKHKSVWCLRAQRDNRSSF